MKVNIGNPNAIAYFGANPDERYWYYSPTLRVPNPRMPWDPSTPWPGQ